MCVCECVWMCVCTWVCKGRSALVWHSVGREQPQVSVLTFKSLCPVTACHPFVGTLGLWTRAAAGDLNPGPHACSASSQAHRARFFPCSWNYTGQDCCCCCLILYRIDSFTPTSFSDHLIHSGWWMVPVCNVSLVPASRQLRQAGFSKSKAPA